MSVLIRGMEMPGSCGVCKLRTSVGCAPMSEAKVRIGTGKREKWCPLVELPGMQTTAKPVRWIPVEEQLPETDKLVLAVKSNGDMAVAVWNAALGWLHYWSGSRVKNVTHWMPLPEPLKQEEG